MAKTLSKKALFRRLGYEPHEGQWLVHRSTASRRVLACGARWGKTVCGSYEALAAALEPCEESVGWIVGPTYELTDRIFRRVQLAVLQHLEHRVVEMHERQRWFTIRNMAGGVSEVRCKTAENPVSLLGEGLDWVIVDEAARIPADIWDGHLAQRLVDKRGWALLLSTPRGLGWFYRAYKLGQKERDAMFESWCSPTVANPYISAGAVEAERERLGKDAFAQEFEAGFIGAEDDPCDVCGGPSPDVSGVLFVHGDEEIPTCPECGDLVDGEGKTVVRKFPHWKNTVHVYRKYPEHELGPVPEYPAHIQKILDADKRKNAEVA